MIQSTNAVVDVILILEEMGYDEHEEIGYMITAAQIIMHIMKTCIHNLKIL